MTEEEKTIAENIIRVGVEQIEHVHCVSDAESVEPANARPFCFRIAFPAGMAAIIGTERQIAKSRQVVRLGANVAAGRETSGIDIAVIEDDDRKRLARRAADKMSEAAGSGAPRSTFGQPPRAGLPGAVLPIG